MYGRTSPLISVLIPVFNGERHIAAAVESVLAQRDVAIELIVVDDGSRDRTPSILKEYGGALRVVSQPNRGLAAARNAGLAAARGEFLALFDADDICEPDRLTMQLDVLRTATDAVLCSSDFAMFDECGSIADSGLSRVYSAVTLHRDGIQSLYPQGHRSTHQDIHFRTGNLYPQIALGNVIQPGTVMFHRGLLEKCGRFDESLGWMCDFVWLCQASRAGPFAYVPQSLVRYRVSPTQMSAPRYSKIRAFARLRALESVIAADPQLYRHLGGALRYRLAEARLDAAEAAADSQPVVALPLFLKGVLRRPFYPSAPATLAKMLLPSGVTRRLRRLRHGAHHAQQGPWP